MRKKRCGKSHAEICEQFLREWTLEHMYYQTRRDNQQKQIHSTLHERIGEKPPTAAHVSNRHKSEKNAHLLGRQKKTVKHIYATPWF